MPKLFSRLTLILTLAGAIMVFGAGAGPAGADICMWGDIHHEMEDGTIHEHECVAPSEEAEAEAAIDLDTTTAEADPVPDATGGGTFGGPFVWSPNMTPMAYSARNVPTSGTGANLYNSDLAFQGNLAFQGTYAGFRIIDISNPADPIQLVNYTGCSSTAGQGDLVVYDNILVRTWDSPASGTGPTCGGVSVGNGFEGISIFNIANPSAPVFVRNVRMASSGNAAGAPSGCGGHTATGIPAPQHGSLYLYVGGSSTSCTGMDVVRISLTNLNDAVYVRRAAASRQCHDNNVILGDANLAVCAGGNGLSVFSFDPEIAPSSPGGLEFPTLLYSRAVSGVSIAHSAAFSYDGDTIVFGHEPGGGSQAQCQSSSTLVNRSIYFFDALTGNQLGSFVHQRPQLAQENCTWHNFNVVPTYRGDVFVSGNYQKGIAVVDFSDPANATEIAFADPARLGTGSSITLGGDWSTYWYNGRIWESDIRRGVIGWELDNALVNRNLKAEMSNPQTQTFTFDLDLTAPETSAGLSPAPTNGQYPDPWVTLTAEDENSGVEKTQYSVDGGPLQDYVARFRVTGDGEHTVTFFSTDVAGNVEATDSQTFVVNATVNLEAAGSAPVRCNGPLGAITVPGDMTVMGGATCSLDGTTVRGILKVKAGGTLIAEDSNVTRNIECLGTCLLTRTGMNHLWTDRGGYAAATNVTVRGVVECNDCLGVDLRDSSVAGDVSSVRQTGPGIYCGNTIGGSLYFRWSTQPFTTCAGNTIGDKLELSHNSGTSTLNIVGNQVAKNIRLERNKVGAINFQNNAAGNFIFCVINTPTPTASGNTANSIDPECGQV